MRAVEAVPQTELHLRMQATLEGALQNEFLAFSGNEIISLFSPELIATGH